MKNYGICNLVKYIFKQFELKCPQQKNLPFLFTDREQVFRLGGNHGHLEALEILLKSEKRD